MSSEPREFETSGRKTLIDYIEKRAGREPKLVARARVIDTGKGGALAFALAMYPAGDDPDMLPEHGFFVVDIVEAPPANVEVDGASAEPG